MPMPKPEPKIKGVTQLESVNMEQLIDRVGLHRVVCLLETICQEKAQHIESNWQDRHSANRYRKVAKNLEMCAERIDAVFHGED